MTPYEKEAKEIVDSFLPFIGSNVNEKNFDSLIDSFVKSKGLTNKNQIHIEDVAIFSKYQSAKECAKIHAEKVWEELEKERVFEAYDKWQGILNAIDRL